MVAAMLVIRSLDGFYILFKCSMVLSPGLDRVVVYIANRNTSTMNDGISVHLDR